MTQFENLQHDNSQKIKEQNEILTNIIKSITHPFYVINTEDYTIEIANSAAHFDVLSEHQKCYELTHKNKKPCQNEHPCPLEIVKKTREPVTLEHIHYDKEGNTRNIEVHGYPILDKEGNVSQIIEYSLDITERKKMETELKESEERYRSLFENMNSGFAYHKIILDEENKLIDYEFLDANPAFEEFTGLKIEEIIGKTVKQALPGIEDDPADWIGVYGEVALTGVPISFEKYSEPLDRWYYVSAYSPEKEFFAVTFTDITKRKKTEEMYLKLSLESEEKVKERTIQLQESESRYRELFNNMRSGVAVYEPIDNGEDFVFKSLNKSGEKISKVEKEEIIGKSVIEKFPGVLSTGLFDVFQRVWKTGIPEFQPTKLYKDDRITHWMENYVYKLPTGELVVVYDDASERKQIEQELKTQERFVSSVFNSIQDGICVLDKQFNIIRVNPKMKEWFSKLETTLGQKCYYIFHDRIKPCEDCRCYEKIFNDICSETIIKKSIKNQEKSLEIFSYPFRDLESGEFKGIVKYIRDVTEKKEAEDLIIKENTKLQELNQMKIDLINRVSHELKTPLNAIFGSIQLLLKDLEKDSDKDQYKLGKLIYKGGKRLKQIVFDLVESSKFELNSIKLKKKEEDLNAILKNCIEELIILANKRKIFISADLGEVKYLYVDRTRIEQVIINIISNAINNTQPGGRIFVKLNDNRVYLDISIKDTGIGITDEEKDKLFTKFGKIERYGKGLDVDIDGWGLGLYISKEIVLLHGGEIIVKSEGRNKGAEFIIRLFKIEQI